MMQPWTKYRKLWETPNSCNSVNSARIQWQEISAPFADATGNEWHTQVQLSERAVYVQQKSSAQKRNSLLDHTNDFQLHSVVQTQEERIRLVLERLFSYSPWSLWSPSTRDIWLKTTYTRLPLERWRGLMSSGIF